MRQYVTLVIKTKFSIPNDKRAYRPGVAWCFLWSHTFARPFSFLLLVIAWQELNIFLKTIDILSLSQETG